MDVLPIGVRVKVGLGEVPAIITAVNLRSSGVQYEVVWWDGRNRHQEWVSACEVETDGPAEMNRIGFTKVNERVYR